VPDKATLLFEFRHLAEDDPEVIEARIQQAADAVKGNYADVAHISLDALAGYPGLSVAVSEPLVSRVRSWCDGNISHVAFGTEAGVLSELGIQTVVCGPGSMAEQGHKPDEFISEHQLAACSNMLRKGAEEMLYCA